MGKTGIRTVGKVSFDTPASEQKVLHVSSARVPPLEIYLQLTLFTESMAP